MNEDAQFTCKCGKQKAWVEEGKETLPCPNCGRVYVGKYDYENYTLTGEEVQVERALDAFNISIPNGGYTCTFCRKCKASLRIVIGENICPNCGQHHFGKMSDANVEFQHIGCSENPFQREYSYLLQKTKEAGLIIDLNYTTIRKTIVLLNELLEKDPVAITELFLGRRVQCNKAIADHPTVQVLQKDDSFVMGVLGLLNGIFGVDHEGFGYIVAHCDDGIIKEFYIRGEKPKCEKK